MRLRRPIHVLCALLAATLCGCGAGDSTKSETAAQSPRGGKVDRREAAPQKPVPTATCRIYTSRPGFAVFVDGRPAFDAKGEILRTPCAVTVPQGQREFTVAREGFRDAHQVVDVAGESRVVFSSIEKSAGGHASLLNAAYLRTETARPIPLLSLNSDRQDLDPYVTPDGRSLYFVSDRNGKKGIYHVARQSAYDYFEKTPRLIKSGSRLPASPMISADSLSIVYALPRLGVVYQISRESAVGEFGRGDLLVKRSGSSARCTSAQVIRDGERSWRLYWLQEARGRTQAYSAKAVEKRTAGELTGDSPDRRNGRRRVLKPLAQQTFGRPKKLDLRGDPPCMSEDGLRQYAFDGKLLTRATRKSVDEPFASPEIIANISLSNYRPTAGRRSYFLTDDEQWLFYESRGDLHMLRVFARPRRGFVLTGKPIPPLPVKVAKLPKKKPVKPVTAPPKVDPRTRPLPYPVFRKQLLALLRDRKYEAAKKHVRAGLAEPKLADDRNLIAWDREDVRRTSAFWDDFRKAVKAMKPGDMFSIGSARVKFVKFSDGAFVAQSVTKRVVKPAAEMRPSDLIAIVDKKLG
ncbi:MAG: TolB family protein, partial [Planctomycetaceae bacterium]